jgi:hypothetical protein
MQLSEAIAMIKCDLLDHAAISQWADLGCGSGLFTSALAHYLPEGSTIYAIDQKLPAHIPGHGIKMLQQNFVTDPLPQVNGILMANSLHYVQDKSAFLDKVKADNILIIEYDIEKLVPVWVPYPVSFRNLAVHFPGKQIIKLHERPSVYGQGNMYAALVNL